MSLLIMNPNLILVSTLEGMIFNNKLRGDESYQFIKLMCSLRVRIIKVIGNYRFFGNWGLEERYFIVVIKFINRISYCDVSSLTVNLDKNLEVLIGLIVRVESGYCLEWHW